MEGIVSSAPPSLTVGDTTYGSLTPSGGLRSQQQDGAGNDVSAAHPFPVGAPLSPLVTGPSSTLTRPANTTAYAQNELIASSTTAGSVVVPSFAIANAGGAAAIPEIILTTNVTTGWGAVVAAVRFWSAAPTYTNGDGGAYGVATGAAGYLGSMSVTLSQFGDGAAGVGTPAAGSALWIKLASGSAVYWDLQYTSSGSLTPISGQTFTLTPVVSN
jgi:hypothetical protein